ncbi:MAG TPA: 4-hydroxy-tetrahydrodipicolinate synthase [Acidimicrobiales bacterium]|nr:4-hydroxy-tetrahydrodipicolinate synthase [Acidimicrobiales bacterium]
MISSAGAGRFGAVVTAMVTPFDDAGILDVDGAVTLARWLTAHGSDGLVVAGTTGEGPVLSDAELGELWRAVSEAVTVPVIAGTGSNDTRHSIECTKLAADAGAAAALVVTPYYSRPSQAGLAAHFAAVASATALPVLLYDIPVRAGRKIAHDTMVHLARDVPTIVGVKDAAGDPAASARVVAETPDGFELYSGDDALTLPLLAVGAVGVVSVASHWAGSEMGDVVAAFAKGDADGARMANAALFESYDFESSEAFPNPLPAKAACRVLGLPVGQCRLPLGVAPPELEERARGVLRRLGRDVRTAAGASVGGSVG